MLPLALNLPGFYLAYTNSALRFKKRKHSLMSPTPPSATSLRVAGLSQATPTPFALRPDAPQMKTIAKALGLDGLRKLSFEGEVKPVGSSDWQLTGTLGATVVQPCVVTLEPVTTRIDTQVVRTYLTTYEEIDEPEAEMPEDDTTEPLGAWIDPGAVIVEALTLALPEYPRKGDAASEPVRVTEPGKEAMTDEQARPFAGLAALKDELGKDRDD